MLVTRCTSAREGDIYRFVCFCLLTLFTLFPKRYEFLFLCGLFCQGSLNTVREFPKFVRHLVRVLKVVLFKVFLDFRFNWGWRVRVRRREREEDREINISLNGGRVWFRFVDFAFCFLTFFF